MNPQAILTPGGIAANIGSSLGLVAQALSDRSRMEHAARREAIADIRYEQERQDRLAQIAKEQAYREQQDALGWKYRDQARRDEMEHTARREAVADSRYEQERQDRLEQAALGWKYRDQARQDELEHRGNQEALLSATTLGNAGVAPVGPLRYSAIQQALADEHARRRGLDEATILGKAGVMPEEDEDEGVSYQLQKGLARAALDAQQLERDKINARERAGSAKDAMIDASNRKAALRSAENIVGKQDIDAWEYDAQRLARQQELEPNTPEYNRFVMAYVSNKQNEHRRNFNKTYNDVLNQLSGGGGDALDEFIKSLND